VIEVPPLTYYEQRAHMAQTFDAAHQVCAHESIETRELFGMVLELIEQLSLRSQQILLRRFVGGKTRAAVAREIGWTPGRVETRERKAIEKIVKAIYKREASGAS
jgi:RNA polymerase sigma factor (sigma-70 family)